MKASRPVTSWPPASSASHRWEPMKPAAPVTTHFMRKPHSGRNIGRVAPTSPSTRIVPDGRPGWQAEQVRPYFLIWQGVRDSIAGTGAGKLARALGEVGVEEG